MSEEPGARAVRGQVLAQNGGRGAGKRVGGSGEPRHERADEQQGRDEGRDGVAGEAEHQRIAEAAAGSARTWAVVTTIDPVAVVRGSLSIDGLQLLLDADLQLQHVDRLRTHCLFVGRRALLGSANLGRADERAVYLDGEEAAAENLASPMELAVELTDEHVATFLRVIEHTVAFADALQAALTTPDNATASDPEDLDGELGDEAAGGRPQLRAI